MSGISNSWRRGHTFIFAVVNSKCNSEIQLTTAISKNVENKMFDIGARDRLRQENKYVSDSFERSIAFFIFCVAKSTKNSSLKTKRKIEISTFNFFSKQSRKCVI